MTKTPDYKIYKKLNSDENYHRIFQFKDVETIIRNYSSSKEGEISYIFCDPSVLEKIPNDEMFIYILQGQMTIIDENKNPIKHLHAHDFFEINFTDASQKIFYYTSHDLKFFVVNNNPDLGHWVSIADESFSIKASNNFNHQSHKFSKNYIYDFFKVSEYKYKKKFEGVKLESEEFYKIADFKNFKVLKAIYRENEKVNLFLKDKKPKNKLNTHNSVTHILNGEIDIVEKHTGKTLDTLYKGDTFTSKSYDLYENYYFISRNTLELLVLTTDTVYTELYESINNFHEASLKCQEKDMYTHLHNGRVSSLSMTIANKVGLSKKRLESLRIASLFHDIGKAFTPDEILLKPDKLTDAEYEIMKQHVIHSFEMTKNFIDEEVCKILVQHHERLNGSGYPYGLKEIDICLEGKIIAIADTYDAMTSDRPYRKALPSDVAMEELIKHIDIHYDKELVQAFHDTLQEQKLLKKSYF